MPTITPDRLAALLAKARADKAQKEAQVEPIESTDSIVDNNDPLPSQIITDRSLIDSMRARMNSRKLEIRKLNESWHRNKTTIPTPAENEMGATDLADMNNAPIIQAKKEALESPESPESPIQHIGMGGNLITYNAKQQEFVTLAASGVSCVLIGAAGTGKTTCMQGALEALIRTGKIPLLEADNHKYLIDGTPGCVIIAYTRRATNNIRKVLSLDLKHNAITAHKLIEYKPVKFSVIGEDGLSRNTMRFLPSRDNTNPLPGTIATIVVEEASMLSLELFSKISVALKHKIQWIFLGDINQLPPVFGAAVLGYRLLDLPVVELTEVYRQALESPIIRLAHRILSGKVIELSEFPAWKIEGKLTIHPWKKKICAEDALRTLAEFFKAAYDKEVYNVDEDVILIPYNKACGTIELNKHIANHIARKTERTTYEIIAGFNKHYFSIGDKVLYDKEDAEIIEINPNMGYTGAKFQAESKHLDYWGYNPKAVEEYRASRAGGHNKSTTDVDIDFLLGAMNAESSDEDRVRKASHVITLRLADSNQEISVDTASDVNNILHAYALTVHKSQGSEWRKVYLCFHQSHATMLSRELLYTAVTRAKEELYIICEPDTFIKGINKQRIKGNTLAEKAEYFKGKVEANETTNFEE